MKLDKNDKQIIIVGLGALLVAVIMWAGIFTVGLYIAKCVWTG